MAKQTNTDKKPKASKNTDESSTSIISNYLAGRRQKKAAKTRQVIEQRVAKEKQLVTDEKMAAKAKKKAIEDRAKEDINSALDKSQKRRSHPVFTLFIMSVVVGISAAGGYLYRETEIVDKNSEISTLEREAQSVKTERAKIEADKRLEEARFKDVIESAFTISILAQWEVLPTELPSEQFIYGDAETKLTVVINSPQSNNELLKPSLDYLWFVDETTTSNPKIASKSRHCQRFDTINNDPSNYLSIHSNVEVICDTDDELAKIYVIKSSDEFGFGQNETYFIFETSNQQAVDLADITKIIESYTTN